MRRIGVRVKSSPTCTMVPLKPKELTRASASRLSLDSTFTSRHQSPAYSAFTVRFIVRSCANAVPIDFRTERIAAANAAEPDGGSR